MIAPLAAAEPAQLDGVLGLLIAVFGCIAASAFFSFSETCLTSLSHSRIHALLTTRGRQARVLNLWLERPHQVLTTILVGNTVVNSLAAALLGRIADQLFAEKGVTIAVAVASFLILIFGEITPKTLARQHALRAAVPTLLVLRVVHVALWVVTWVFARISEIAVKLLGLRASDRDVTEAEIEALIDLGAREGVLSTGKAEVLRAVLDLGNRTVREVMVARTELDALDLDLEPGEFVRRLDESGHSRVPVFRGTHDDIVGVVHAKDVLHLLVERGGSPTSVDLASILRQPLVVPESLRLDRLLRLMRRGGQHLAVVVDEYGGTAGIATLEDVLEELVGDIRDEHDEQEAPELVRRGPGRWRADGRLPLTVLQEKLGLELPEDATSETVGGLLMELAGAIPKVGSVFELAGFRFEVLDADARRVGLVRLIRLSPEGPAARS